MRRRHVVLLLLLTATVAQAQAPTMSTTPSLTVDDQILLSSASAVFQNNELFIWGDAKDVALGLKALKSNTSGTFNTALGPLTLSNNENGQRNTAVGYAALYDNLSGSRNVAVGTFALVNTYDGQRNTAIGEQSMVANIGGDHNTAAGASSLQAAKGSMNSAFGSRALTNNSSGSNNIALGYKAGHNLGFTFPDPQTGASSYNHNIFIGNEGVVDDQNLIRIGTPFDDQGDVDPTNDTGQNQILIAGIYGTPLTGTHYVVVDANGQIGQGPPIVPSSRRYKEDVQSMSDSSRRLLELHPVTFRFKEEFQRGDPSLQFGLIAEEVAEVFPELVSFDEEGRPEAVRYRFLSSILLDELQRQHRWNEEQATEIRQLTARLNRLENTDPP